MNTTADTTVEKFTPGPWAVYEDSPATSVYCDDEFGNRVADCNSAFTTLPKEQRIANAKLIAAAPDLYAACKEFIRKVEAGEAKSTASYEQMKAAIQKATE